MMSDIWANIWLRPPWMVWYRLTIATQPRPQPPLVSSKHSIAPLSASHSHSISILPPSYSESDLKVTFTKPRSQSIPAILTPFAPSKSDSFGLGVANPSRTRRKLRVPKSAPYFF